MTGGSRNKGPRLSEDTMFKDLNPPQGSAKGKRKRPDEQGNNEAPSTITSSMTTSAGEDCETPSSPKRPDLSRKHYSSKSSIEAPSTITSKKTSSGEASGSLQPRRLSFSSAILEEIPAASVKLMMKAVHFDAHFQVLETQFALMQNQITTLISTMKELHSAFHDHQDPVD